MKTEPCVFLGAGTPWVYALAAALAANGNPISAVAPYDFKTYLRAHPRWPLGEPTAGMRRRFWVLPPGYVGALAKIFGPLLRWRLARERVAVSKNGSPWIICPYPWFHGAVRDVPDERLIYFNLDDYSLYHPKRAALIRQQEDELLRRAALTLCLSQRQVENLRARASADRAACIRHFPLGVVASYLNPHPERVPSARTVGYVGNLTDRVDWRLVRETALALPDVEFIFVGGMEEGVRVPRADWQADRALTLALPNVRRIGLVGQDDVPPHYWKFGVNWIPYTTDHAFNQAACPTKIMDGIASGRPMASADLPECRLYPEWISIARNAREMACLIRAMLSAQPAPTESDRAARQVDFARGHLWQSRAQTLHQWLSAG